jgi:serine/threonine protein kinase
VSDQILGSTIQLTTGTLLGGKYRLLAPIGQGGTSTVWKAVNTTSEATVSIKMLRTQHIDKPTVQRFQQESKALARLDHVNILKVLHAGMSDDNVPYIVTDYIPGHSLAQAIQKEAGVPYHRSLAIFRQIAKSLVYAHEQGIVHRDIKPSNIMLAESADGSESVKLVDFGIALIENSNSAQGQKLTKTGVVLGSPAYLSPEQCLGQKADARSDIYSFGVLMLETLTGTRPFEGDTVYDTYSLHITNDFSLELLQEVGNVKMRELIEKCLQRQPSDRYATMSDLLQDLQKPEIEDEVRTKRKKRTASEESRSGRHKAKEVPRFTTAQLWIVGLSILAVILMAGHVVSNPGLKHDLLLGADNSIDRFKQEKEAAKGEDFPDRRPELVAMCQAALAQNEKDHLLEASQVCELNWTVSGGLTAQHRPEEGAPFAEQAIKLMMDNSLYNWHLAHLMLNYGYNMRELHRAKEAIPLEEKLIAKYPADAGNEVDMLIELSRTYTSAGQEDKAMAILKKLLARENLSAYDSTQIVSDVHWLKKMRHQNDVKYEHQKAIDSMVDQEISKVHHHRRKSGYAKFSGI